MVVEARDFYGKVRKFGPPLSFTREVRKRDGTYTAYFIFTVQ